jgi:hypothetical protein
LGEGGKRYGYVESEGSESEKRNWCEKREGIGVLKAEGGKGGRRKLCVYKTEREEKGREQLGIKREGTERKKKEREGEKVGWGTAYWEAKMEEKVR